MPPRTSLSFLLLIDLMQVRCTRVRVISPIIQVHEHLDGQKWNCLNGRGGNLEFHYAFLNSKSFSDSDFWWDIPTQPYTHDLASNVFRYPVVGRRVALLISTRDCKVICVFLDVNVMDIV